MHTNGPKEDPLVELGYENRDVDYKKLRKAIIIFLTFGLVSALIGAWIYTNRFMVFNIQEPKPGIDSELKRTIAPSGTPFIQDNVAAKVDIADLRQAETKRLTGTGYTDETHTFAYIPIEKAMELVVQRGVTAKSEPSNAVEEAPPTTKPTEGAGAIEAPVQSAPIPSDTPGDTHPPITNGQ